MAKYEIKSPGKLYIAGEYNVVAAGQSAIIASIDRFLHVTIEGNLSEHNSLYSEGYTVKAYKFQYNINSVPMWQKDTPNLDLISHILQTVELYRKDLGLTARHYDIHITSELNHQDGQKYGLGSSGALTVGLVRALSKIYRLDLSDLEIYKLAALSQLSLDMKSSLGDLAAIAHTGLIKYSSPDRKTLKEWLKEYPISEIVQKEWPKLKIIPLTAPAKWQMQVGWTKMPASSEKMVSNVQSSDFDQEFFHQQSEKAVKLIEAALSENNWPVFVNGLKTNQKLLNQLSKKTGVIIETDTLSAFIHLAKEHHGVAKTSGAGGGDCGIAWFSQKSDFDSFQKSLIQSDITPLNLNIYKETS